MEAFAAPAANGGLGEPRRCIIYMRSTAALGSPGGWQGARVVKMLRLI